MRLVRSRVLNEQSYFKTSKEKNFKRTETMNLERTGKLIRSLRKQQHLTQSDLANRINVTTQAVSKWETGKSFPDPSILETLADALGCSVENLLVGDTSESQGALRHGSNKVSRDKLKLIGAGILTTLLVVFSTILLLSNERVVIPYDSDGTSKTVCCDGEYMRFPVPNIHVEKTSGRLIALCTVPTHTRIITVRLLNADHQNCLLLYAESNKWHMLVHSIKQVEINLTNCLNSSEKPDVVYYWNGDLIEPDVVDGYFDDETLSSNAICIYDNNELNPIFDNDIFIKQIENIPNQYEYFTIPISVLEDNGMAITDKGLEINHTDVECNLEVNGKAIKLQIYPENLQVLLKELLRDIEEINYKLKLETAIDSLNYSSRNNEIYVVSNVSLNDDINEKIINLAKKYSFYKYLHSGSYEEVKIRYSSINSDDYKQVTVSLYTPRKNITDK